MREIDFFNNYEPINSDLLFKKVVRISWEMDYEYLYQTLVDLNFNDTKKVKDDVLRLAVESNAVLNTIDAKQKYWDRLVEHLAINFNYQKPISGTDAAERMRKLRAKKHI